jgi:hypothetical protein
VSNTIKTLFQKLESATDTNLKTYFTQTVAINRLADFNSTSGLAVGLKGIGKTAAFRYFTEFENSPDIVIGIDVDKFGLHLPNKNLNYGTCRKQFEHDLVLEALRAIVEKRSSLKGRVTKHYLDAASEQVTSYLDTLKSVASRVGGMTILGCGFTVRHPDAVVAIGLRKQTDVNTALMTLKEICAKGVKIRIVVDDPELVFSASRDLDTHLIGGFCLAALRLSSEIPNLKVIALIKTHVYYPILTDVDDLRKYPDHMERLCWNRSELVDVIQNRLKSVGKTLVDLFEGNEKQARQLVETMCGNVRNGPRDLMRWIDLCLQAGNQNRISGDMMLKAKPRMSSDSLGEMVSAHSSTYKRIGEVIRAIFRKQPEQEYSLKDLIEHIRSLLMKDQEMKTLSRLPWMQLETSHTLPELLFETGALSLKLNGRLILPYEEGYDLEHFKSATSIQLAPALIQAIR